MQHTSGMCTVTIQAGEDPLHNPTKQFTLSVILLSIPTLLPILLHPQIIALVKNIFLMQRGLINLLLVRFILNQTSAAFLKTSALIQQVLYTILRSVIYKQEHIAIGGLQTTARI